MEKKTLAIPSRCFKAGIYDYLFHPFFSQVQKFYMILFFFFFFSLLCFLSFLSFLLVLESIIKGLIDLLRPDPNRCAWRARASTP